MIYVDANGVILESVDLRKGRVVDKEWEDIPEVPEQARFEYETLPGGGRTQTYVVNAPDQPARRNVSVHMSIPYTQEEMDAMNGGGSVPDGRVDALEAKVQEHDDALNALIGGVANA